MTVDLIRGETFHGRKGAVENSFRYSVDYVLLDADRDVGRGFFARNRRGLFSVHDVDHGGPVGAGRGATWVREVLGAHGVQADRVMLMAQPRVLGHVFNPVSFWLCYAGEALAAVIAEVTNTYGERHSYLCRNSDGLAISREDTIVAEKIFYVSPFQPVEGGYRFRFDIRADRVGVWIDYSNGTGGLFTNLIGPRVPLTSGAILWAALRRPFGSRRVLALIHWQALKLAVKGVAFRRRPVPPETEVSQ
ncbi:DUF1365 domain-containing protein [Gemmobacter aquarius]|uniref:DUF1365 domain-containing protein n=1 Tax=Paragemmobacter aquarius TaxID=2169400 RepID=A0A2S0UQ39_9RHOB|nr:DUF1365 domain-containing protein [Gemmobacter aquarius]AWB49939.1 DUF1365 domain-containing protein [Gemmobacter aquarius]